MSDQPLLLTTGQAAKLINVPAETLRFWRHQGRGPVALKLGRAVRYQPADITAWLAEEREVAVANLRRAQEVARRTQAAS
jgi:excisionase family DNA binding protein